MTNNVDNFLNHIIRSILLSTEKDKTCKFRQNRENDANAEIFFVILLNFLFKKLNIFFIFL